MEPESGEPKYGLATLVIPIVRQSETTQLAGVAFGDEVGTWRGGPLGRLTRDEAPTPYTESHGYRVAEYSAAAAPRPLNSLFLQSRFHYECFDSPIHLRAAEPGRRLHQSELEVWRATSIEALELVRLDESIMWGPLGADLLVLHIRLHEIDVARALRLLLRLSAPLAEAVVLHLYGSAQVEIRKEPRVGVGVAVFPNRADEQFTRDESAVIWDRNLDGETVSLLNGRLTHVSITVAAQFLAVTRAQAMIKADDHFAEPPNGFRTWLDLLRNALIWPVVDFSAAGQTCYKELREAFFLPQLLSAISDHIDQTHQAAVERLQRESNEAAERLAVAQHRLAWAGGIFAAVSLVLGVIQILQNL